MRRLTIEGMTSAPAAFAAPAALAALAAVLLLACGPVLAAGLVNGQGLLWRIQPIEGQASHIFGTIHLTDERVRRLPAAVQEAFGGAASLTVEIERTNDMPLRVGRLMMLRKGDRLSVILGETLFSRTALAAAPFGVNRQVLDRLKPWAAFVSFSLPPSERARQAQGALPLDHMLQARAEARGLPVHSLETIEEQLGVFDSLPRKDQVALLRYMVEEADKTETVAETVLGFYLARNVGGLMDWMSQQMAGDNARLHDIYTSRLLQGRNLVMVKRIAPHLSKGGAFIAVGAAHLPGKTGIIELLAGKGYKVSRIY